MTRLSRWGECRLEFKTSWSLVLLVTLETWARGEPSSCITWTCSFACSGSAVMRYWFLFFLNDWAHVSTLRLVCVFISFDCPVSFMFVCASHWPGKRKQLTVQQLMLLVSIRQPCKGREIWSGRFDEFTSISPPPPPRWCWIAGGFCWLV